MKQFLDTAMQRFEGSDICLFAVWPILFEWAEEALAAGMRQAFGPGSVLMSGGGNKGRQIPDDYRERIFSFLGFERVFEFYSMPDPVLREKLRPNYRAACKRLIFSPDYYRAIQHPNAELVTEGIETVTEEGVLTRDGVLHELDVLVLASGFHADRFMRPMQVVGRDGCRLDDAWATRPNAYLAVAIPQFPNFFMLNGPTSPVGNFSLIDVAETQWGYIAQLLDLLRSGACREISATQASLDAYEAARLAAAKNTIFASGCKSWYLDGEGVPASWPWTYARFKEVMAAPDLEAFELRG